MGVTVEILLLEALCVRKIITTLLAELILKHMHAEFFSDTW